MIKVDNRCILIDTREKTPWKFKSQKRVTLKHGDYSILRGKHKIVIERKSLIDLYVTLSPKRWIKFKRKMTIAVQNLDYVFIFIEASLSEVYHGVEYTKMSGTVIVNKLIELMELGIQVVYTGNTKKGPMLAETILRKLG